jgi:7,8-dihydroneopterin aldolase/epimerase/oxygenase
MSKILLEDIELYAYHGHFPEEKNIGSRFLVNAEIDAALDDVFKTDNLKDTFDYQKAYNIIVEEMKQPTALLEKLADRIAGSIINSSEIIQSVKIKVAKLNPPLGGSVKSVAVEVIKVRNL